MKRILLVIICLAICIPVFAEIYTVKEVVDCKTLKLSDGQEVSLIGIECPEGEMGKEATEFVKRLIKPGDEVRLEFDVEKRDRYKRLLAYVSIEVCCDCMMKMAKDSQIYYKDNCYYRFVNSMIVKRGYAQQMTIPPNVKYEDLFKELHREAISNQRGLWDIECSSVDECSLVDCSALDIPVREGNKSDCVDGRCKCMCYGCE